MVREGSGQTWGTATFRDRAEDTAPSPTHQHRVHSWEVLAPAHLLTRELLPHKTRQSQDLWDKSSLLSADPELPTFGWLFFLPGARADLMGCRVRLLTRNSLPRRAAPISCPIHSYLAKSRQEGLGTYMSRASPVPLPCPRDRAVSMAWDGPYFVA